MRFVDVKVTLSSNDNGILRGCFYFNIPSLFDINKRMYFYKYNIDNVVELHFGPDTIIMYKFPNNPKDKLDVLNEKLDFYKSYFESAGLAGKRFLFDLELKLPISYMDFEYFPNPTLISSRHAFIFEQKDGYITMPNIVSVYDSIDALLAIDNTVLALANGLVNISEPKKGMTINGVISSAIICGLLSGNDVEDIRFDLYSMDLYSKFYNQFKYVKFNNKFADNARKMLKFNKLRDATSPVAKETQGAELDIERIPLSDLIDIGLDSFIKMIKYPRKAVMVDIDYDESEIKLMYIINGAGFIIPLGNKSEKWFKEMFESDNVQLTFK